MIYEGTVRIALHPTKGIILAKGNVKSTLTAADADKILTVMVESAMTHKVGIDRWSLWIPELKLAEADKQIPVAKVKPFLVNYAAGKLQLTLRSGKWTLPQLMLAAPMERSRPKSGIIDIA